jgi:hypothetical protein
VVNLVRPKIQHRLTSTNGNVNALLAERAADEGAVNASGIGSFEPPA